MMTPGDKITPENVHLLREGDVLRAGTTNFHKIGELVEYAGMSMKTNYVCFIKIEGKPGHYRPETFTFHSRPSADPAAPAEPAGGGESMSPVSKGDPLMITWEAYKAGPTFENTRRWALNGAHVEGSLWAAFEAGFRSNRLAALQAAPADPVAGVGEVVAWQARIKGSDHWYALDFEYVEARKREPQIEVRPLYAAPSPDAGIVAKLVGALERIEHGRHPTDTVMAMNDQGQRVATARQMNAAELQYIAREALASARQSGGV